MIQWKEEWNLGIKPIDKQHQNILKAINFLCDWACQKESDPKALNNVIRALDAYAGKHFAYEEHLLAKISYKGLDQQKYEHKMFMLKNKKIKSQLQNAEHADVVAQEIVKFLQAWLKQHIFEHDAAYAPEIKAYFVRKALNAPPLAPATALSQPNPDK